MNLKFKISHQIKGIKIANIRVKALIKPIGSKKLDARRDNEERSSCGSINMTMLTIPGQVYSQEQFLITNSIQF